MVSTNLPYRLWRWRNAVEEAANQTGMDKYLIWAIMDRESLCGDALTPVGSPQGTGDGGHGRGLMQIDDRFHIDFCKDIKQWGDAYQNILYGAALFRMYQRQLGSVERAIAAYNAGPSRVQQSGYEEAEFLDMLTTGKDYVTDVLRRQALFTKLGES